MVILDQPISLQPELAAKVQQLKQSQFFVGTQRHAPYAEKQSIFLVLAGLKPVGEAFSGHWVPTATGRRTIADDPKQVGAFLESLGLSYSLQSYENRLEAVVALRPELVNEYRQPDRDSSTAGRLFGYPETAVLAFASGDLLPNEEQDKVEEEAGVDVISTFRFSRNHWPDELAVVKRWYEAMKRYGLLDERS